MTMTWLNIGEMLRVNAVKFGDKECLKDEHRSMTFKEYNERCNRLANAMRDLVSARATGYALCSTTTWSTWRSTAPARRRD